MKRVVLVFGPGRSGTTLVTRIVARLGASLGDSLKRGDRFNPDGYFEDTGVIECHRALLSDFNCSGHIGSTTPLPDGWMETDAAQKTSAVLMKLVEQLLDDSDLAVVKDPRISVLLPIWREIAAKLKIRTSLILATRHPAAMALSYQQVNRVPPEIGEAIWLNRMASAVVAMGDDGLVADYDDLLGRPREAIRKLAALVRPDETDIGSIADQLHSEGLVQKTSRHHRANGQPAHPLAMRLYEAALREGGGTADRAALVETGSHVLEQVRNSARWMAVIREAAGRLDEAEEKLRSLRTRNRNLYRRSRDTEAAQAEKLKKARNTAKNLRAGNKDLRAQNEDLRGKNEGLRGKNEGLRGKNEELRARNREFASEAKRLSIQSLDLRVQRDNALNSGSYELGNLIVRSIRNPGFNTLRLPYDVAVLYRKSRGLPRAEPDAMPLPAPSLNAEAVDCEILFLGPAAFRPGIWSTRASYIFPDLIRPLDMAGRIIFVCGAIPDWASDEVARFEREFGVSFRQAKGLAQRRRGESERDYWARAACTAAEQFHPRLMTNIFGGILFGYANAEASKLVGAKSLMRVAGDEIASRLAIGTYRKGSGRHKSDLAIERFAVEGSDRIIVMAEHERQRLGRHLPPDDRNKIEVCIRGIDTGRFTPCAQRRKPAKVLYVGRKSAEKGYDLVERIADLAAQRGLGMTFHFAGNFEKGRNGNREYYGFVPAEDLPRLYAEHDCVVNTSVTEGLPQSVCEALAVGRPCVVPAEIFGTSMPESAGVIACDRSERAYLAALTELFADTARYAKLSKRARRYAETHLDKARWAETYRDIVTSMLK